MKSLPLVGMRFNAPPAAEQVRRRAGRPRCQSEVAGLILGFFLVLFRTARLGDGLETMCFPQRREGRVKWGGGFSAPSSLIPFNAALLTNYLKLPLAITGIARRLQTAELNGMRPRSGHTRTRFPGCSLNALSTQTGSPFMPPSEPPAIFRLFFFLFFLKRAVA